MDRVWDGDACCTIVPFTLPLGEKCEISHIHVRDVQEGQLIDRCVILPLREMILWHSMNVNTAKSTSDMTATDINE
jgi:hypothetical protein